jgi:hypothetical protein
MTRHARQKRLTNLNNRLNEVVEANDLDLSLSEIIGDKILGWDHNRKVMVVVSNDIKDAAVTNLNQASRSYVLKNMNGTSVKSISLQITDPGNKLLYSIPFYKQFADNEMKVKKLEEQAKEWELLLNNHF